MLNSRLNQDTNPVLQFYALAFYQLSQPKRCGSVGRVQAHRAGDPCLNPGPGETFFSLN